MKLKKNLAIRLIRHTATPAKLSFIILLMLCMSMQINGKNFSNKKTVQRAFEKANSCSTNGKYEKAAKIYRRIIRSRNDLPEVYFNLGLSYVALKQYDEAIITFQQAIQLKPDYVKAMGQLAHTYLVTDKKTLAEDMLIQALLHEPNNCELLLALAELYAKDDRFDEAIEIYRKAYDIQPKNIRVLFGFANMLNTGHYTQEALEKYFDLLQLAPNNPSIIYNTAYTLKKLNRLEEALPYYLRALELNPNHAEAHFSYSLALLLTSNKHPENWTKGWAEYEWRWQRQEKQLFKQYIQPVWKGSDLHGKTLFIWSEQGPGDQFQFIRYAHIAKQLGARKVIVAVHDDLYDIIKLCPYIDLVLHNNEQPATFDYHVPMLSMPLYTKTKFHAMPQDIPYLFADPSLVEHWKEKLSQDKNFKVGICWQGNPNYTTQFLRMAVAAKSMPIAQFASLAELPGVTVYSLQQGIEPKQHRLLAENKKIITFEGDFDNAHGRFMDTAAVMKNLDLVITVDSSICHLAAGLGVPTWTLLPNPPDWRWMLDCDNTPWYPNMRLFRQAASGDWENVMQHVVAELKEHFETGKPLISFRH